MGAIRLLLVEDDARLRSALARALARQEGLSVVAEAGDGATVRKMLEGGLEIDVAFVDLVLGATSGLDVIRAIRELQPRAAAVALTVFDDAASIRGAILAGACGYVLKDIEPDALAAAAGGAPMTPGIARWVVDAFRAHATEEGPASTVTARELEVVELLCEGRTYAEIATVLGVSLGTVQSHVKAVYAKLEVSSKAELAALAFRKGLVR